jgi:hypothetical protein
LFSRQTFKNKHCDIFLHLAKKIRVHLLQYYSNDGCKSAITELSILDKNYGVLALEGLYWTYPGYYD